MEVGREGERKQACWQVVDNNVIAETVLIESRVFNQTFYHQLNETLSIIATKTVATKAQVFISAGRYL